MYSRIHVLLQRVLDDVHIVPNPSLDESREESRGNATYKSREQVGIQPDVGSWRVIGQTCTFSCAHHHVYDVIDSCRAVLSLVSIPLPECGSSFHASRMEWVSARIYTTPEATARMVTVY